MKKQIPRYAKVKNFACTQSVSENNIENTGMKLNKCVRKLDVKSHSMLSKIIRSYTTLINHHCVVFLV